MKPIKLARRFKTHEQLSKSLIHTAFHVRENGPAVIDKNDLNSTENWSQFVLPSKELRESRQARSSFVKFDTDVRRVLRETIGVEVDDYDNAILHRITRTVPEHIDEMCSNVIIIPISLPTNTPAVFSVYSMCQPDFESVNFTLEYGHVYMFSDFFPHEVRLSQTPDTTLELLTIDVPSQNLLDSKHKYESEVIESEMAD